MDVEAGICVYDPGNEPERDDLVRMNCSVWVPKTLLPEDKYAMFKSHVLNFCSKAVMGWTEEHGKTESR